MSMAKRVRKEKMKKNQEKRREQREELVNSILNQSVKNFVFSSLPQMRIAYLLKRLVDIYIVVEQAIEAHHGKKQESDWNDKTEERLFDDVR